MGGGSVIVRFAPSPTGSLHIGNIRTALFNWLVAKSGGGQFILRMDDTDIKRATKTFADGIVADLSWLGIEADKVFKQSARSALYAKHTENLKQAGLLYACYESPQEIERKRKRLMARGLPPVYDRAALKLTKQEKEKLEGEGKKPHWRFLLPNFEGDVFSLKRTEVKWHDMMQGEKVVDLASLSDPVLIRGDGSYLYTLPSVIDDIDMGVSHVIRGGDHITNTAVQIALFNELGGCVPSFAHHNLLVDEGGKGLTKRDNSLSIKSLREAGIEAMSINSLAVLVGSSLSVEPYESLASLAKVFVMEKISRSPSQFRVDELEKLNEKFLHGLGFNEAKIKLERLGLKVDEKFWNVVRANISKMDECIHWHKIVCGNFAKLAVAAEDEIFLKQARDILEKLDCGDESKLWQVWSAELKRETGRGGKQLFMPIRKVLTGQEHGPDMSGLLFLIGKAEALKRLG